MEILEATLHTLIIILPQPSPTGPTQTSQTSLVELDRNNRSEE